MRMLRETNRKPSTQLPRGLGATSLISPPQDLLAQGLSILLSPLLGPLLGSILLFQPNGDWGKGLSKQGKI